MYFAQIVATSRDHNTVPFKRLMQRHLDIMIQTSSKLILKLLNYNNLVQNLGLAFRLGKILMVFWNALSY